MQTVKFIYWQKNDMFFGHFVDYPDHWTQGTSLGDFKDHLLDLYSDLTNGQIPGIRKVDELTVAERS